MSRPIGPPPITTTDSPAATSPRRVSWQATASGSASAARRSSRPGGSLWIVNAGTVHDCWNAPGLSIPMNFRLREMWLKPLSAGVSPRVSSGRTTTASPGSRPATLRADLGDGARHLVADHLRSTDAPVHVPVGDVEVGAADAAVGDVEPHLARAGRQTLGLADREPALALVVDRGHSAVSPPERTARASSFSISWRSHCSPSERWIRSAALARSASRSRSAR